MSGKKKISNVEDVTINIGLMLWCEKECKIKIKRGKKLPLIVTPSDTGITLCAKAERKWSMFMGNLYDSNYTYSLLYESGEIIDKLPGGSNEKFILGNYRTLIGKDYKRITFYLAKSNDLIVAKRLLESKFETLSDDSDINVVDKEKQNEDCDMQNINYDDNDFEFLPKVLNEPKVHCIVCPTCQKRFPLKDIELHADTCAESKRKRSLDFEDQVVKVVSDDDDLPDDNDDNVVVTHIGIMEIIKNQIIDKNESFSYEKRDIAVQLEVRRFYCFEDFKKYFDKKWNIKKKNLKCVISFVGESGIDVGGLSRDFYAGILKFSL